MFPINVREKSRSRVSRGHKFPNRASYYLEFKSRDLEFKSRDLEFQNRDLEFKYYYGMVLIELRRMDLYWYIYLLHFAGRQKHNHNFKMCKFNI